MKIGQLIKERYEIVELLGEGGMAFVYKAKDMQLERMVAIKTLKPNYVEQTTFVERFKREAQTAANLNHPNIVQIFDWGIEEEPYFVMEYIEGNTLTSIISNRKTCKWTPGSPLTRSCSQGYKTRQYNDYPKR